MAKTQTLKNRLYKYRLTEDEYHDLLDSQNGCCTICQTILQMNGKGRGAIDHCHSTKMIRGLLCHGCNIGLGYIKRLSMEAVQSYLNDNAQIPIKPPSRVLVKRTPEGRKEVKRAYYLRKKAEREKAEAELGIVRKIGRPKKSIV